MEEQSMKTIICKQETCCDRLCSGFGRNELILKTATNMPESSGPKRSRAGMHSVDLVIDTDALIEIL